ncbi:MAG: acetate--CoA ligase family protein [Candidatus Micrarchaeia archaeon]
MPSVLPLEKVQMLLDKYQLKHARSFASKDSEALRQASISFEFPIVLKALSSEVLHKTEHGLIVLNISDEEELKTAFERLRTQTASQGIKVGQYLVQEQKSGVELIVGGKNDESFGPTLMFGFGGVFAELLQDVAVLVCPVEEKEIHEMIRSTHAGRFFSKKGFRGMKANRKSIERVLENTSRLLIENPNIQELDFNPVIASQSQATIVDARIITK